MVRRKGARDGRRFLLDGDGDEERELEDQRGHGFRVRGGLIVGRLPCLRKRGAATLRFRPPLPAGVLPGAATVLLPLPPAEGLDPVRPARA